MTNNKSWTRWRDRLNIQLLNPIEVWLVWLPPLHPEKHKGQAEVLWTFTKPPQTWWNPSVEGPVRNHAVSNSSASNNLRFFNTSFSILSSVLIWYKLLNKILCIYFHVFIHWLDLNFSSLLIFILLSLSSCIISFFPYHIFPSFSLYFFPSFSFSCPLELKRKFTLIPNYSAYSRALLTFSTFGLMELWRTYSINF